MAIETLQRHIGDLGTKIGIEDLALDEDGLCLLQVDEKILLHIQYDEDTDSVVLAADIARIDETHKQELFRIVLEANFYWLGSAGGTFSLNSGTQSLVLAYRENLGEVDFDKFQDLVQGFVNTVEFWMDRLERTQQGEPESDQEKINMAMHFTRA